MRHLRRTASLSILLALSGLSACGDSDAAEDVAETGDSPSYVEDVEEAPAAAEYEMAEEEAAGTTARYAIEGEAPPPAAPPPEVQDNLETDTSVDRLATFSLDVDTASYTQMRRDLRAGRLPAPSAVRVEEVVNFFDFRESAPMPSSDPETPFSVNLESAPHPFDEGRHLMRVAVRADDVPAEARPETNLVFLVDVSGSMTSSNKIGLVQYSLATLVDSLRPEDHVSIVVYAGSDAVVLEPTAVQNRGRIFDALAQLRTGGGTNGAAGIRTAYDLAARNLHPGGINRVILCTDGDFNVGVTGDALMGLIRAERDRGITLTVLGYGEQYGSNDHQMEQLADQGNGSYAFIDSEREALRVLSRDLQGTLQVVAGDVKVQVAFNNDLVQSYRLVGYENRALQDHEFDDDSVDAAEVGSGDFVTAFLEVQLREGVDPSAAQGELAEVRLRYKPVGQDASVLRTYSLPIRDTREVFSDASPAFRFGAAAAELATVLRQTERSHPERLPRVISIASEAQDGSEDQRELIELARAARGLMN